MERKSRGRRVSQYGSEYGLMDSTPQAYPAMSTQNLSTLSTQLANAISEHFMPSVPAIPILAPTKWVSSKCGKSER
jgi:hypothetical protein